jgi:hypothetical protein
MPTWSNQLPTTQKHMGFDLRRTPQSAALQAIITCEDILVCDTHYWGGRTMPCERIQTLPDGSTTAGTCAACNESIPYRTHVYVSAMEGKSREHFIFECTAHAAKTLAQYREANGTLRGCIFHASRPKGLKNSQVVIQTNAANLAKVQLPDPPNLVRALSTIWRLPLTGLSVEEQPHQSPEVRTHKGPLNRMREQPDNQPEPQHIGDIIKGNGKPRRKKQPA